MLSNALAIKIQILERVMHKLADKIVSEPWQHDLNKLYG